MKRNTQQRRRSILDQLSQDNEVSVDALARIFDTSQVTIRKDLAELEVSGLLLRRFGGAVSMPKGLVDNTVPEKVSKRKVGLAKAAASLIRDHNRIIIDSGRTTAAMLPELSLKKGLVVMTNSLNVANALCELENEPTLLMTGGTWDPRSEAFQGVLAEQVLRAYDFDQLFIGADGIDLDRGTTTYNELFSLSRVMAEAAREVVVMAESEKFGRKIHNLELPWSCIDCLVTDDELPEVLKYKIEKYHQIKVICSPS